VNGVDELGFSHSSARKIVIDPQQQHVIAAGEFLAAQDNGCLRDFASVLSFHKFERFRVVIVVRHKEGIKAVPFVPRHLLCLREETVVAEVRVSVNVQQNFVCGFVPDSIAWKRNENDHKERCAPHCERRGESGKPLQKSASRTAVLQTFAAPQHDYEHDNSDPNCKSEKFSNGTDASHIEQEGTEERFEDNSRRSYDNRKIFYLLFGEGFSDVR
jgi:hypothetical protein|tara:strand:+ start:4820 stop:5464 length:645 start_codon:yes stop_codon:yes gene_type:complete